MSDSWTLTDDDGELLLHTGTAGRAARTGHKLTIAMKKWTAQVSVDDGRPVAVTLTVDVDSLTVLKGEGGIAPWTGAEPGIARSNALKSLEVKKHPTITYVSTGVTRDGDVYAVDGDLTVHGVTRPHPITVRQDGAHFTCEATVTQTDFGIKPFSLMMGTVKVADDVRLTISATAPAA
ncbi:YceI family protein [Gordonia alkaliphila]|uniref:YceI family protein n=1 Tax=Gordonia alkaliphila TaxID=1053547 RepID=UPI001FF1EF30|nr:YceI family protein [Gordonia alkaliphila]MCK0439909.1 YceI family protein [Gordonia alkaliphila]